MKRKHLILVSAIIIVLALVYVLVQNNNESSNEFNEEQSYVPEQPTAKPIETDVEEPIEEASPAPTTEIADGYNVEDDGDNTTPRGPVPEIEEGWKELGAWEVDLASLPNYHSTVNSFSYLGIEQMIGAAIINEGMTDMDITVSLPEDITEFDSEDLIYCVTLHGDVDYILYVNAFNYTYLMEQ